MKVSSKNRCLQTSMMATITASDRFSFSQVGRMLQALAGLFLVAALLTLPVPISAQTANAQFSAPNTSTDYLGALQIVNSFLWAWVSRDGNAGLQLMSTRLRAEIKDESWLKQFMVGLSNPRHQAFEVGPGRMQGSLRYSFPVTLYELSNGEKEGIAHPGTLELVRQGDGWRVDVLPNIE